MFTGIITDLGKLTKKEGVLFTFNTDPAFCKKIDIGTSVAINGACLTVTKKPSSNTFSVEPIPETLNKTMLGYLKIDDLVNLELPVTPQTFLSGHLVQGHIDGVTKLKNITKQKNSYILKFSIPTSLSKYIAEKGSIAINGISLTVIDAKGDYFTVGIIPFTWDNTMLSTVRPGDFVNIEVDILAKYLEKVMNK
ncbi:riboflavin synthase subunit alpha [Candidatus Daviesbacteria bacterium RIFCSPHIGHO2_01_FULL_40_11]|uniref:Riboflavin synthase n=1 Tax=Candidatus Daviesbacteria bacterium RIFCSPHIGHO2_01_FULL_40_11 TaxID=1797762 RepID=A0A1F5JKX0_9BACT|nr:MAG: riboflavin synthase subunit alpha [Candidatus Daviesbacteria bacterium RIFCSPHIGHO2_01_FULL_40_11]OGE62959.1 MAG: riboflavin synthase subunit alpha [Candidatus Daviesbacteria bacterium RIFCSPLOWO2_01_FULL_40_27]